jgi:glutathione synthase/RimK-type ligase-like ATP-grasp enzyme
MAKTKISLAFLPGGRMDERIVSIGTSLIKKWKVPAETPLTLRIGAFHEEVRVIPSADARMRIHPRLAERAGVLEQNALCLRYKPESRTLILGPVVGVLLRRIGSDLKRPFGNVTSFCRELTMAAREEGALVFFFGADQLPEQGGRLTGMAYANDWRRGTFPVPDVVYNRLTSRIVENSEPVRRFLNDARNRYGCSVFNERYLDKAEVFDALKREPGLNEYIPESYSYQGTAMIRSMLERHPAVFLKPILSSLGKGIIRIRKSGGGTYESHTAGSDGTIRRQSFPSLAHLLKAAGPKLKKTRYLIQEGLELIAVGGAPVDFRALVQRGGKGEWRITSIVARIAAPRKFVSNLARGGKLTTVSEAFAASNLPAGLRNSAAIQLKKAALDIARGLETQIDAHFAELGIDLAVDTRGRVMLLEVNSKPSKDDNTPLGAERTDGAASVPASAPARNEGRIRPSVRRVIRYSQYLREFTGFRAQR